MMTTEESKFFRPLAGEVLILDDPDYIVTDGVVVKTPVWRINLDYWVVRGGGDGFGVGDKVLLDDAQAGRKIKIDGVGYRVVPVASVVATVT